MMQFLAQKWFRLPAFILCLIAFSYFIHHPFPLRAIAFGCMLVVAWMLWTEENPGQSLTGEANSRYSLLLWLVIAVIAAMLAAGYSRAASSLSTLPTTFYAFTLFAMMIGAMEEILFRGWMFSQFQGRAKWRGIVATAAAHAAYKAILFFFPYLPYQVDQTHLFLVTFQAGLLLGLSRVLSGSVWPALLAHAVFDLIVYGDQSIPWWVF